jgi:hypothetical protein
MDSMHGGKARYLDTERDWRFFFGDKQVVYALDKTFLQNAERAMDRRFDDATC